jgi:hypothetical protein
MTQIYDDVMTILIDDMRCWKEPNDVHGFYEPDIFEKLKEINNDYKYKRQIKW